MYVGVISDIHGNLPALNAVLAEFEARGIEEFVCLGDMVGVLGSSGTVASLIKNRARDVVVGNHDLRIDPQRDWMPVHDHEVVEYEHTLNTLDDTTHDWLLDLPGMVETEDGLFLAHSRPDPDASTGIEAGDSGVHPKEFTNIARDIGEVALLLGHTHTQHAVDLTKFDGQSGVVLNPGAVGFPYHTETTETDSGTQYTGTASFALIDTDAHDYNLGTVQYDSTSVINHLRDHDLYAPNSSNPTL